MSSKIEGPELTVRDSAIGGFTSLLPRHCGVEMALDVDNTPLVVGADIFAASQQRRGLLLLLRRWTAYEWEDEDELLDYRRMKDEVREDDEERLMWDKGSDVEL